MTAERLGGQLQTVRDTRGLSLKSVADPAEISPTYLQKLERGEVRNPSPHVLHRLAGVLDVSYVELMKLAGYVVPASSAESEGGRNGSSILAQALSSEDLSEDEERQVADFLAYLRHKKPER